MFGCEMKHNAVEGKKIISVLKKKARSHTPKIKGKNKVKTDCNETQKKDNKTIYNHYIIFHSILTLSFDLKVISKGIRPLEVVIN